VPPKKEDTRAQANGKPKNWDNWPEGDATAARVQALFDAERAILDAHDGKATTIARARLLSVRFAYAADMLEQELGVPALRAELEEWIHRAWRTSSPYASDESARWRALLWAIVRGSDNPYTTEERRDAHDLAEAASEVRSIKRQDPEFAEKVSPVKLAAIFPVWRRRRHAGSRGGQSTKTWPTIVAFGVECGLARITEKAAAKHYEKIMAPYGPDHMLRR
jgi:hypothetical protein